MPRVAWDEVEEALADEVSEKDSPYALVSDAEWEEWNKVDDLDEYERFESLDDSDDDLFLWNPADDYGDYRDDYPEEW